MTSAVLPPELFSVAGHRRAQEMFAEALRTGIMHPALLLSGPRGIGKAQLALQWALKALRAEAAAGGVHKAALSGGHPDFLWIGKGEGSDIPVAAVQDVVRFFARRAAMGGMRVVVIDAVDDLNRFGVNALLKTLEEPPPRSLILLVHHGQKRLLPTVVSRCVRVVLSPLTDDEMTQLPGQSDPGIADLVAGRPRRAVRFADPEMAGIVAAARRLFESPAGQERDIDAVLTAAASGRGLEAVEVCAFDCCVRRARKAPNATEAGYWGQVFLTLGQIRQDQRELVLDPSQAAMMMVTALQPG